ncbi:hypothetical protein EYC84_003233 [Monilinia fructicola]|uniref:Thioredoxin domain-containing protein n=1 Tax=Monilinia fructicola TaxID=38448 RepID=A0A5M9JW00_MONFR|nr:hypothetical protein EYC84_003233 [Monilinia fructicola]
MTKLSHTNFADALLPNLLEGFEPQPSIWTLSQGTLKSTQINMSNSLDPLVAKVLDRAESDDEDALIASLEEDPAIDAFREQRLQQLHSEYTRAKSQKTQGFGTYTEIKEEKALMDLTTEVKYAVVHFSKDDFARCGVMDTHLTVRTPIPPRKTKNPSPKHTDTRFLKIDVENAPFLVTKLNVKILPCVLVFIDGRSVDRIVGFEGLGYTPDTFTTKDLEARLLASGAIKRHTTSGTLYLDKKAKRQEEEDDDDDDWDD